MYGCLRAVCKTISASFDLYRTQFILTKVVYVIQVRHVLRDYYREVNSNSVACQNSWVRGICESLYSII